MTNTDHIHRQQKIKYTVEMQSKINAFALEMIPKILEFTEAFPIHDEISLPENDCDRCEEFALDSEDIAARFLIDEVLSAISRNS